ncbi:MAG: hypothetical protein KKA19_00610 [Candidatus Margulisbacteria bacterium]|nr:hypothetical protein [Candidatus Margulisiibacteriota bacterium]
MTGIELQRLAVRSVSDYHQKKYQKPLPVDISLPYGYSTYLTGLPILFYFNWR